MFKLVKNYTIFFVVILVLSSCIKTTNNTKPYVNNQKIRYNKATYIKFSNENYIPPTKNIYKSLNTSKKYKHIKSRSTKEMILSDLRGVLSDEVYAQLEQTQAENPIKGYNNIEEDLENNSSKELILKDTKIEKEEISNQENIKIENHSKKPDIKITKKNLIGLTKEKIATILKEPNDIEIKNQMLLWKYSNNTCRAQLYFYADSCLFIETDFNKKGYNNSDACLDTFRL